MITRGFYIGQPNILVQMASLNLNRKLQLLQERNINQGVTEKIQFKHKNIQRNYSVDEKI